MDVKLIKIWCVLMRMLSFIQLTLSLTSPGLNVHPHHDDESSLTATPSLASPHCRVKPHHYIESSLTVHVTYMDAIQMH
jgi:hypothetical protein